jgi:multidrug resistance efflux pump
MGTVTGILVRVGDTVKRGQHLVIVGRSISIGDMNVDEELASNDRRIRVENEEISRSTVSRLKSHLQSLNESKRSIDLQIRAENDRLRVTSEKAALVDKAIARNRALVERGFISKVQFDNLQTNRLDLGDDEIQNKQRVLALTKQKSDILDDIVSTRSSIAVETHKAFLTGLQSDQARFDVSRSEYAIDSPIDGTVLDVKAIKGQSAPAGALLVVVGTSTPLGVEIYIPAHDVSRVQLGQRATATLGDEEGGEAQRITGRVVKLSGTSADSQALQNPELESKTSYFRAVIAVANISSRSKGPGPGLKVGSSVYANVQIGAESFFHWAFSR